jgi:hypothetical protein
MATKEFHPSSLGGSHPVDQTRSRTDRRRRYRHEGEAEVPARATRVTRSARAGENVIVNVHVHNAIAAPEDPAAVKRHGKKAARRFPTFRGTLFSWNEHYQPIVKRLAPMFEEREKLARGALRLRRFCLVVALLAAVAAGSCGLF